MEQNAFIELERQTGNLYPSSCAADFLRQQVIDLGRDLGAICHRAGQWYVEQAIA